ncbi:MAG: hypothetical protein AAGF71_11465 [Pseudomonadota bacterium]
MADADLADKVNLAVALVTGASIVIGFVYWVIQMEVRRSDSWFRQELNDQRPETAYQSILAAMLNRLDRWLVPEDFSDAKLTDPARAWNWKFYDRILRLAMIYPLAIPFLVWMTLNWPSDIIGLVEISPGSLSGRAIASCILLAAVLIFAWHRTLSRLIHSVTLGLFVKALRKRLFPKVNLEMGLTFVRFALLTLAAFTFASGSAVAVESAAGGGARALVLTFMVAIAVVFAVVVAHAFAATVAIAREFAGAIAVLSVATFAVAFAHLIVIGDYVVLFVSGIGAAFLFLMIVLGGPAVLVGVTALLVFPRVQSKRVVYILLTLFSFATFLWLTTTYYYHPLNAIIGLFFGILPLSNAIFDFASLGLTRYLLRCGLSPMVLPTRPQWLKRLAFGTADVIGAALILWLLCLFMVLFIGIMNQLWAAGTVLNLPEVRQQIIDRDADLRWLYITVLSTFVPSLVHISIALIGVILWPFGKPWKGWVVRQLESDRPAEDVTWATFVFSATVTTYVVAIGALLCALIYVIFSGSGLGQWIAGVHWDLLDGLVWSVFEIADQLGLLIDPTP